MKKTLYVLALLLVGGFSSARLGAEWGVVFLP